MSGSAPDASSERIPSEGGPVSRTSSASQDLRTATFPDLYERWTSRQITLARAAGLLGMSERTFRRYAAKYRKFGRKGLADRRTTSSRSAPSDEIAALEKLYADGHLGWRVRKFFRVYRDSHGGGRSYTWVKNRLQEAGLVARRRSARSAGESGGRQPAEGLLLHQANIVREWLPTRIWQLVLVVDDARCPERNPGGVNLRLRRRPWDGGTCPGAEHHHL